MKIFTNTLFLIFLLLILIFVDIVSGSISLWDSNVDVHTLLLDLRLPKTVTAIAVGGALSVSGLVLQIIFRNPLAGPYVLGISSASSLFASLGIMGIGWLGMGIYNDLGLSIFSIAGAVFGLLIIMLLLKITAQITVILLVGLMLSQLYGAVQSVLSYMSTEHSLKIYTLWTMGSIQNTNIVQAIVLLIISIVGGLWTLKFIKALMIYITGDIQAEVLGINVDKMKRQLIAVVAIVVGIITAYCGPVALVGMSIPVLVRVLNNNADVFKWLIHSYLYGSISVLLTDIINQIFFDGSVPLNILISMWGVPLIIWILLKQMKWVVG